MAPGGSNDALILIPLTSSGGTRLKPIPRALLLRVMAAPLLLAQALSPRRSILRPTPAAIGLVAVAVVLQILAATQPDLARVLVPIAFALGTGAIVSVAWMSTGRRLPPTLAGVGAVMNLIPISIYGAMPVVRSSREAISDVAIAEPELLSAKHTEIDLGLGLAQPASLLSDWIAVPSLNAVISVGDIFLFLAFLAIGLSARADQRVERFQPAPNAAKSATEGSRERIAS